MNSENKIDQRYEVLKNLGGGLSGEVLLVQDHEGKKALKFLKKVQMNVSREEALTNFKNEFSILKELNHPNINRILDFGFDTRVQKYFFTNEYIEGTEFHQACQNQPLEVIERLIVQVLRALNYLHSRGIYHFDIKPQNILVHMKDGVPTEAKIIDFGLAGFNSPRKKVGTPAYMAPEVIQGGVLDGRTDLYSFGVLIYRVLTGINPFATKSLKETLTRHLDLSVQFPSELNNNIPKYWDHIIGRILEKNPVDRYSQASLVIRDLNFLSGKEFEIETKDTKLSYLPEKGALIGREKEWRVFTDLFDKIFLSDELPNEKILILAGEKGTGKTRLLSEMKYFSQLRNVPVKTLRQFESEEKSENFILMIDSNQADSDIVNSLMQKLSRTKCFIIWAVEKAPVNWANTCLVHLHNYDKSQLKQYLESVTGLSSSPEQLIDEVYHRTQGNPLFVTEFIKSLLEQGHLFDASGKWNSTTFQDIRIDFDKIHIPNSVEEYLRDKFHALPGELAEVLKWMAVNASPLYLETLSHLTGSKNIQRNLLELINGDIIEKTSREHTYYFKNLLFVDIIYKLIEADQVPLYHDKIAETFKEDPSQRLQYLYHLGHGTDQKAARNALFELGSFYLEKSNYDKADQSFKKLIEISGTTFGELEIETYFKMANVYNAMKDHVSATSVYKKLETELAYPTDARNRVRLLEVCKKLIELSVISVKKLDIASAIQYREKAKRIIPLTEDKKTNEMIFRNCDAFILFKQNKIDEAQNIYEETYKQWCTSFNTDEKLKVDNNRLVEVYLLKKENDKAIETCLENIKILKDSKQKYQLAMNYYALGYIYYLYITTEKREDIEDLTQKCIDSFNHCEQISREISDYGMMLRAFNGLGNLYTYEKQNDKALDYYNRALAVSRKTEELFTSGLISYNIGRIHMNENRHQEGYSYIIYAINTLENLRQQYKPHAEQNLFFSYNSLAEIYLHNKNYKQAHVALDKSEELFKQVEILSSFEYWKLIRRAQIFFAEGQIHQGKPILEKAKKIAKSEEEKDDLEKVMRGLQESQDIENSSQNGGSLIMMSTKEEQHNTKDDLKKIIEINKLINSEYDTKQLLKIVLNYALQLTNAEAGFFLLLEDDGSLVVRESINTNVTDIDKISMSIARRAIEKGEIVSSSDALSDERFDTSESIVLNELKSVLCLPVRSKNKSIGVFYLDNRYRINAFEECNVDLLNAFCDQVGIALENNELIVKLKQAQTKLEDRLEKTTEELAQVKDILKSESETYTTKYAYKQIISQSQPMREIFKLLDKVTETNLAVFISGDSGTGKELVAKALHYNNPSRAQNRFVAINCGAIPANLMESELFGYKAGSFTGANKDKKGLFEEASGGTLFLDEIGELDSLLQVKLLRVLQEGEVQRIGDSRTTKVNVRIISASHKDMEELAQDKLFREDLFYRLCQMKINLPPLKERSEDIPLLAKHFVKKYKEQSKLDEDITIPPDFMKALLEYEWPGNIRELENLISVACALKEGNHLSLSNIPPNYGIVRQIEESSSKLQANLADLRTAKITQVSIDDNNIFDVTKTWKDYEAVIIAKCYETNQKKKMPTAECLKQSHSTIYKKISELNLDDESNPLYADGFVYDTKLSMKEYILKIFEAALKHHNGHPYAAIRQLNVSQGYFYKIMKEFKHQEEDVREKMSPENPGT